MVPSDELCEKWSYGVAHSTVLINVTDFSFNLMSICCKAACLYMFSIFLWLTNAHLRSYSLTYHSSFCITLPILFSLFHCDHLEWNCCSPFLGLLQDLRCTFRVYALCVLSRNTSKPVCTLPCCTQKLRLLKTFAQYSYLDWSSHTSGRALVILHHYDMHFSQRRYKVFLQLSKSPHRLQLVDIDFENITANYSSFFFLLAWKDTVEAECLQLFIAWASCYISRVCVFRATTSIEPVFLAPAHLRKVL